VAYVLFPLAAAWLAWAGPATPLPAQGRIAERWVVVWLFFQGAVLLALATACCFAPSWITTIWPWKISPFLAQVYSGPLIAYAVASLVLTARRNWPETLIPAVGTAVFAVLALIGSARHLALFSPGSPSQLIWFAALGLVALGSLALVALALRNLRIPR
jgi:hypothetical protein